jgi:hypothetical protein
MTTIKTISPSEKKQVWFGVEDTKGRKVGAVSFTHSIAYENSVDGLSTLAEGTYYFFMVLQNRGQKWFDSTMVRSRFDSEKERDDALALLIQNIGAVAVTKFAA